MALLRLKYGAKPRNLELFYDRRFFSCLFAGEQSICMIDFFIISHVMSLYHTRRVQVKAFFTATTFMPAYIRQKYEFQYAKAGYPLK